MKSRHLRFTGNGLTGERSQHSATPISIVAFQGLFLLFVLLRTCLGKDVVGVMPAKDGAAVEK
jgi:hypothetical protein